MPSRYSGSARLPVTGVLNLRAWLENDCEDSLRIRMVGRADLESDTEEQISAATVDEAVRQVRAWLHRFPPLVRSEVTNPVAPGD
jgi:hypothetical protein